jgi:hypothetical protein
MRKLTTDEDTCPHQILSDFVLYYLNMPFICLARLFRLSYVITRIYNAIFRIRFKTKNFLC